MTEQHLLLDEFLSRWPSSIIPNLKLNDYVGLGNKDTFCQWVETKTRHLGSIKGMTSIKFGIYERKPGKSKPKNYNGDEQFSWLKSYNSRTEAFNQTLVNLTKVIEAAEVGRFEDIDDINIPNLFKWKVAFLYSNERLIPIYNREVLFRIARFYGLETNQKTKSSAIHRLMIQNKPAELDVFRFMWYLFEKFADKKDRDELRNRKPSRGRKAATSRNTSPQTRTITLTYIAEQKHNKLQETLEKLLVEKHGRNNVILEENFVDIKVLNRKYIALYEVKSAAYASDCVKQALGQILMYSFREKDERPQKIFIAGQYAPTKHDDEYIQFIKDKMDFEFDYITIDI